VEDLCAHKTETPPNPTTTSATSIGNQEQRQRGFFDGRRVFCDGRSSIMLASSVNISSIAGVVVVGEAGRHAKSGAMDDALSYGVGE